MCFTHYIDGIFFFFGGVGIAGVRQSFLNGEECGIVHLGTPDVVLWQPDRNQQGASGTVNWQKRLRLPTTDSSSEVL